MSKHKNTINVRDGNKHKEKEEITDNVAEDITEQVDEETTDENSEVNKLKDLLLRKAAEFENYKRRTDSEIASISKYASERIIKELLPVYDDLQRSIESVNKGETKDFETLQKGVNLIYDKFKTVLEKEGLTEINTVGQEFDVELSTALMLIPKDDVKPHTVLESFEKGYKLNGKVIRHEKVLVSTDGESNN
ncbi:MAG: nucleotide exchange factor GrpE [Ignavibacteria bacterium]|jgi:molecular chaperone GrpE|nr:nucleotide exchange factor GrpE [Ignavibacteria bacterium]MBK9226379.1 nucleotide exchange factor GrpE [Ignavibacteria bacterium]